MAARTGTADGTAVTAFRVPPAGLRLLVALVAGVAILVLWGSGADARTADPAPVASSDGGLLGGLVGPGGALTPVVDVVDGATTTLTGTAPVGTTVTGVAATVDPVLAPVVTPVTDAADPVLAPVLDTVTTVTTTLTTPATVPGVPTVPEVPGVPGLPTDPSVPGTVPGTELPPLEPPASLPGTPDAVAAASRPFDAPSAHPLVAAPGSTTGAADRTSSAIDGRRTGASSDVPAEQAAASSTTSTAPAAPPAPGADPSDLPASPVPHTAVPVGCAGAGGHGPGGASASWFVHGTAASHARGASRTIGTPTAPDPARAPGAGPEVSPD